MGGRKESYFGLDFKKRAKKLGEKAKTRLKGAKMMLTFCGRVNIILQAGVWGGGLEF